MKTERTLELLKDFKDNGISHTGKRLDLVIEYQDCIMRSTPKDMKDFERNLDDENRRLFFWANANTLGIENFLDILKSTYIFRKAQDIIDKGIEAEDSRYEEWFKNLNDWEQKLAEREKTFEECKKPIHKRIARLERSNDYHRQALQDLNNSYNAAIEGMRNWQRIANTNAEKARKFDELKALLTN